MHHQRLSRLLLDIRIPCSTVLVGNYFTLVLIKYSSVLETHVPPIAQSPFGTDPSPVDSNVTEIEDEPASPADHDAEPNSEAEGGYEASASSGFTSPDSAQDPVRTIVMLHPYTILMGLIEAPNS